VQKKKTTAKKFIKLKKGYQVQKVTGRASTQKNNEPKKGIRNKNHNKPNEVSRKIVVFVGELFMPYLGKYLIIPQSFILICISCGTGTGQII